ncbi:ABC transporter ATP-binding protein [Planococcus salinus]|uniref:ABC transporter ATP-binding protein n=1 Tax=Planococcus salinus TaxID=1848460 RepID=A0A3M8P9D2_9BACL|nr:ABC transporter ATP-binding protein [Planococcus salinus]RNF40299.1 ABC transporter ATP-binding protein [Planococcus salinus]
MSLLDVKNLTKRYRRDLAVDHLSFSLQQHTATALIGPNGAGKTTALSMLAGLLKPTTGSITWDHTTGVGFLPQHPRFFPWLTALEFTEMAAKLSGVEAKKVRQQATRTLEFVGLAPALNKKTGTFSGGMKQRLGLAQAIVHQPELLLLDEPVSALDPAGRREIMNLLKSLQQDTTILYSTHILNDAEEMTDQLLFLQQGKLVEKGSLEEVKERYAEPRIRIHFQTAEDAGGFSRHMPWEAVQNGNRIDVAVTAKGPGMQEILTALTAAGDKVVGVERQTASLEDIFMKVAGGR